MQFNLFYTVDNDFFINFMLSQNQYLIFVLQHEDDSFNEYFYWFENDKQSKYMSSVIIYDFYKKGVVYQENFLYTPYKTYMINSTLFLEWEDHSKLLAYNFKNMF